MIGGRKGLSYLLGFMCTRAFLEQARRKSQPAAILFVDISSAYYSVVRGLLTGGCLGDASVSELARHLSLSAEDLQRLQAYVQEEPVLCGAESGSILTALVRELHQHTWFLMHEDSEIVRTTRGTRPGSSLADVMYGLLFTRVLERRGDFRQDGWQPTVSWNGSRDLRPFDGRRQNIRDLTIQDLIYADDLATCVVAEAAQQLPKAIRAVAGASLDILSGHGLRPNVGPKKTATLVAPAGVGAREVRKQLFSHAGGRLAVLREHGPGVWLSAVSHYRHLGSVVSFDGSMAAEIRAKLQSAHTRFHEGKREVFCSPRIHLGRRIQLFRSHVLSSLLAGSGAWPCLCKKGWHLLESGFYKMVRQMLRIPRHGAQNWTFQQLLSVAGLPTLEGLLALERLRYLAQLVRSGPDIAFALLQQAPRFLQAFRDAEAWLLEATSCTGAPGDFDSCWTQWETLFRTPGRWKGLLKRAEQWHIGRVQAVALYQSAVRHIWDPLPAPVVACQDSEHACLLCGVAFANCHAWSAHAAKVHHYRSRARRLAVGVRCQACAMRFSLNVQYRRHLQVSLRCCQALEGGLVVPFDVVPEKAGHPQSVAVEGVGVDHLPPLSEPVCTALLQALRAGEWSDDESIFQKVISYIEPLPVLQASLDAWIAELPAGRVRSAASDARLCLQADLWCHAVSHAPRAAGTSSSDFVPLLAPLPAARAFGQGIVLVVGSCARDDAPGSAEVVCMDFFDAPPTADGARPLVGVHLQVPAPNVPSVPFWQPASCTLRALRQFLPWLQQVFAWISFVLRLCYDGVPCTLDFPFERAKCGSLADWLTTVGESSPGPPPLSLRFTP